MFSEERKNFENYGETGERYAGERKFSTRE